MKIDFTSLCLVPDEKLALNEAHANSLGLPALGKAKTPNLAIVGGGHSVASHIDSLREWQGDVWAANGAYGWCLENGIEAFFYSIDPRPETARYARNVKRAVVATVCDSSLFAALSGADVSLVKIDRTMNGPTGASTVPSLAFDAGYRTVSFFGCDSSHTEIATHIYSGSVSHRSLIRVSCNGESFLTSPDMFMQAEMISTLIRLAPHLFKNRSGGILAAMVACPDYIITAASKSIHEALNAA